MKVTVKVFLLLVLSMSLAACSKSKSRHTTEVQTVIKEVFVEKLEVISTFTYALDDNGCSTGTQVFTTIEEMCKGLQNNTLNNNCALEIREDFFAKNCQGSKFEAFSDVEKNAESNLSEIVEQKKMKNGDIIVDFIKLTPLGIAKRAGYVSFSCANSVEEGLKMNNGFILLNGAKALVNRTETNNDRKYPHAYFECSDADLEVSREELNSSVFNVRTIKSGHALAESVIVSGVNSANTYSELSYISCSESKLKAKLIKTNGVNLVKGSRLLVKRDVRTDLDNGVKNPKDYSIIICE